MKESLHMPYGKRLVKLGLTDLKTRRERGDFIQIYKIVQGVDSFQLYQHQFREHQETCGEHTSFSTDMYNIYMRLFFNYETSLDLFYIL